DAVMGAFEQIYGSKSPIDVKDIFTKCKDQNRNILVFGRAGIGKSMFCRYAAYQWATGAIWSEYELVVLIPLRSLTGPKYREDKDYNLVDILINHYFFDPYRSDEQKNKLVEKLVEHIRRSKILWLLDGYDEIAQDPLRHLQILLEQLLKTPHHIITSRPYMNTLSYSVNMEITGFTDENISNYIKLFFNQLGSSSREDESLLVFLQLNPKIWGIAHIPINLELICSVWSNFNWTKTKTVTLTVLYDKLTEWICRRYLEKQKGLSTSQTNRMHKKKIYEQCQNELAFLESLAFHGMKNASILLSPELLEKAEEESNCELSGHRHLLNLGILKSLTSDADSTGTRLEIDKHYYFVHLSFQEYFAARYLASALSGAACNKAIEFIQQHKYNQRYQLLFAFLAGLLNETPDSERNNIFWDAILNEPLDITRMQHMALVIRCLDEINSNTTFTKAQELFQLTARWIEIAITHKSQYLLPFVTNILRACNTICNTTHIHQALVRLLDDNQTTTIFRTLQFISSIPLNNPTNSLKRTVLQKTQHQDYQVKQEAFKALTSIDRDAATKEVIVTHIKALSHQNPDIRWCALSAVRAMIEIPATKDVIDVLLKALSDHDSDIRWAASEALARVGAKAATKEVIDALLKALSDSDLRVRQSVCEAFGRIGEKAVTKEVIDALLKALSHSDHRVGQSACEAFGRIGEKAATKEVIDALLKALSDSDPRVGQRVCEAFGRIGEKAATKEVIDALLKALSDSDPRVRQSVCEAFGRIGEKAATKEVIDALLKALSDDDSVIRRHASVGIRRMTAKAATKEVIDALLKALSHSDHWVRQSACEAFGRIGEKAATKEVIDALLKALSDSDHLVRQSACEAFGRIGEKAATKEVIDALLKALSDSDHRVRRSACETSGQMGKKAATNEVIGALLKALSDSDYLLRQNACEAFGQIGETAATKEVIDALLKALSDSGHLVRQNACEAFGRMGETAVTNKVIGALLKALSDRDYLVRQNACEAFGRMGQTAVTKEVIDALLKALSHSDHLVRQRACEAFGQIGEKAATKEVIDALLKALSDRNLFVRRSACIALNRLDEKATTREIIGGLASGLALTWKQAKNMSEYEMIRLLCEICALDVFDDNDMETTEERIVSKIGIDSELLLPGKLVKILIQTGDRVFLRPAVHGCIVGGAAVAIIGNSLWIHERERVTHVMIPKCREKLVRKLQQLFSKEVHHVDTKIPAGWKSIEERNSCEVL
ncbi:unnamed protein product, partial [Adineta ricciae]